MSGLAEFDDIYREYHPKVLRYVARIAGPSEAEDIAQEVFLKVSRSLSDFRGEAKLSTWIYRIATNAALDRLKSPSQKRTHKGLDSDEAAAAEDRNVWSGQKKDMPDQEAIRKEMGQCINEHMDELPEDYRTVLVLSEKEGFRNKEIAEILDISLDTVKIRLHRARAAFRKILTESCNFYHNEQDVLSCDRKTPTIEFKKSR